MKVIVKKAFKNQTRILSWVCFVHHGKKCNLFLILLIADCCFLVLKIKFLLGILARGKLVPNGYKRNGGKMEKKKRVKSKERNGWIKRRRHASIHEKVSVSAALLHLKTWSSFFWQCNCIIQERECVSTGTAKSDWSITSLTCWQCVWPLSHILIHTVKVLSNDA